LKKLGYIFGWCNGTILSQTERCFLWVTLSKLVSKLVLKLVSKLVL
jgi:hypothetical protein